MGRPGGEPAPAREQPAGDVVSRVLWGREGWRPGEPWSPEKLRAFLAWLKATQAPEDPRP